VVPSLAGLPPRETIIAFKGVDDVTTMPVLRVTLDRR